MADAAAAPHALTAVWCAYLGQLEAGVLEAQVAAGRDAEEEAKVDVDQVPLIVVHDVAVVAVLDLCVWCTHRRVSNNNNSRHNVCTCVSKGTRPPRCHTWRMKHTTA